VDGAQIGPVEIAIILPRIVLFRSNLVEFDHVTADTLQIFKVTARRNVSALKKVLSHKRVGWQTSNLAGKSQPGAEGNIDMSLVWIDIK